MGKLECSLVNVLLCVLMIPAPAEAMSGSLNNTGCVFTGTECICGGELASIARCTEEYLFGNQCNYSYQCINNLQCYRERCSCILPFKYSQMTRTCIRSLDYHYGRTCFYDYQCINNLECVNNKCGCIWPPYKYKEGIQHCVFTIKFHNDVRQL